MNKLTSLFKNPIVISGILLLILMAVIWFLGPSIGLLRFDLRIFIVLTLMVLWVIFALMRKGNPSSPNVAVSVAPPTPLSFPLQAPQLQMPTVQPPSFQSMVPNLPPANLHLDMSGQAASASADSQGDDLLAFRGQLERALQWMRRSTIASKAGAGDMAYRIPWYLVLGPPGSGKSIGLAQSGLNFPYTDPDRAMGKRGIEPTRQCDLWIANEALFLDTAGRFCTGDQHKGAWFGLLDEIRRVRKDKPLDGILLLLDLPQMLAADADSLREQALRIRARLDEMIQRLGLVLPVYLLFNKCDQLEGFEDFFRDLHDPGRGQVWGCTLRREQYQNLQPHQEFEKEFALLYRVLHAGRRRRLTAKAVENRERIYRFPLQWALIRGQTADFITHLFQPNTFRERPIFRGFYFCSAYQDGQTLDLVFPYLRKKAKFVEKVTAPVMPVEIKGYFLQALFPRVIFPDRVLSGTSASSKRRGLLWRIALALGLGVILPLLMWLVYSAYRESSDLLRIVDRAVQTPVSADKSTLEMQILKDLRLILEKYDAHLNPLTPRRFSWGMFVADRVLEPARRLYIARLKKDFVEPGFFQIKTELQNIADTGLGMEELRRTNRRCYLLLKSFLMMSEPNRADQAYLQSSDAEILKFWLQGAVSDNREVENQLSFYAHLLGIHGSNDLLIPMDAAGHTLVSRKRAYLGDIDLLSNYYNRLKREGADQLTAMTLSQALGGKDLDLMTGMAQIPGIFTRAGWEKYAQKAIEVFSADYDKGYWVLAKPAPQLNPALSPQAAMASKLAELYFAEYSLYWQNFMAGARISPFENRREAAEKIGRLTRSQDSALFRFFKTISLNTFEGWGGKSTGNAYWDNLIRTFRSIHQFMAGGEEGSPNAGISQYLQAVAKVHQQLYAFVGAGESPDQIVAVKASISEALSRTAGLMQNFDAEMARLSQPLMEQPIKMALEKTPAIDSPSMLPAQSLAPLVPPNPQTSGPAGGLIVGGLITDQQQGNPLEKVVVYLLKAGNTEVTLNNYLALASTDSNGLFRFPKAIAPGRYGIYIKARGYKVISQDVTLAASSSQLRIGLEPQ